jgi:oligosaccharide repeat unit polymerase
MLGALYLLSIIIYLSVVFKVAKIESFSVTGMYVVYMYFFVQLGIFLQKVFIQFHSQTVVIMIIYNLIFPILLYIGKHIFYLKDNLIMQRIKYSSRNIFLLFMIGFFMLVFYFYLSGGIILLNQDAENFRVEAVKGKGMFIVGGMSLLRIASLMEENKLRRRVYILIAFLMIVGTGFRSQALSLILVGFIIYDFSKNKAKIMPMVLLGFSIMVLYSLIGIFRRGMTQWSILSIYKPFIWRLYVNTYNFNNIMLKYPKDQFMLGETYINDLLTLLPGSQETFIMKLKSILGIEFAGGSLTPSVFGEGYYNFGLVGAVIIPLLYGILILILDHLLRKKVDRKIYYILGFQIAGCSTTGLIPVIIYGFIPLYLAYVLFKVLNTNFLFIRKA